jgi:hypothetical protein
LVAGTRITLRGQLNICDLFSFIDDGRNPDIFTKELTQLLVDKNQKTKGRIDAMQVRSIHGGHLRASGSTV